MLFSAEFGLQRSKEMVDGNLGRLEGSACAGGKKALWSGDDAHRSRHFGKISKCRERLEQECDDAPDNSQASIEGRGYKKTREGHDENSDDEPHDWNDDKRKKKKSKAAKADAGKKIQDAAMNVCMHACL